MENKTLNSQLSNEWDKEMLLEAQYAQQEENQYEQEYRTPNWDMMLDEDAPINRKYTL